MDTDNHEVAVGSPDYARDGKHIEAVVVVAVAAAAADLWPGHTLLDVVCYRSVASQVHTLQHKRVHSRLAVGLFSACQI